MVALSNCPIFEAWSVCQEEITSTPNQAFEELTVPNTVKNGTVKPLSV